ncbi:MAG: 7-carboxy-7-deazaguanine synthase QueE [Gammaproteobacteria bacterium]|nr:7-carboxy-7-deazaguanine synthase QueE [Gammaproteobacteria bacterium]
MTNKVRITEIFHSLQGETSRMGLPTVFIRLTGCPLRCVYCDTSYAFSGGTLWEIEAILAETRKQGTSYVTVTGGEPLAQKSCLSLLKKLSDEGFHVSLETSGALSVAEVDKRVKKIIDVKTPDSGESARHLFENFNYLLPYDELKFVICSRADYDWSKELIQRYHLQHKAHLLFSPSYQQLPAADLAAWILEDKLAVRMQLQLHKLIWGEGSRR